VKMSHASTPPNAAAQAGHEERDVTFRPVVISLIGLVGLIIVGAALMWALYQYFSARPAGAPANPLARSFGRQVPPEPRLQSNPLEDLRQLRAQEDTTLNTYGWVDRKTGVVRIPVERAMELLAQRGLPSRAPEAAR
jgi:hypothetical protein